MFSNFDDYIVDGSLIIIQCLRKMDEVKHKSLLIFSEGKFKSIVTIGDIQRAIISGKDLNTPIRDIVDPSKKEYATTLESTESIKKRMIRLKAEFMPVVDEIGELIKIYTWADFFYDVEAKRTPLDIPVVVMAGGMGTRLRPITNVIPKPLIPIGEKTILEEIMDKFEHIGCRQFYMSVNYKYEIIKFYLEKLNHHYNIEFFKEEKPLGTIGSVSLLKGKIKTPFFVTNCDNLIDQDFRDVYDYHVSNGNDMTIITAIKNFQIPYGVIETSEDGIMVGLQEKPNISYMINTGVYILQPELIDEIPENEFFHITHLMEKVRNKGGRVGCFPVSDGSWTDMGDWSEYLRLINKN